MHALRSALLIGIMVLTLAAAGETGVSRVTLTLSGDGWRLAPDPANTGRESEWYKQPTPDAVAATVPGIIQQDVPGYHGVAWYWSPAFTPPVKPWADARWLIRFGAVDYLADVYVNGAHAGTHEGGETPFQFDVTPLLREGSENLVAVRVLNPTGQPIDGIVLAETPHRNKAESGIRVGGMYNNGGITEPVELVAAPAVRIEDLHVRPNRDTGEVRVDATIVNASADTVSGAIACAIAPADGTEAAQSIPFTAAPGETVVQATLRVARPVSWDLDNPFLYQLTARLGAGSTADEKTVRFGFRDFRVEKGYFRLNGKRIFLRSSHTGNHCPVGQILAPDAAKDLLRQDLIYMKASGFNMVRFIAGMAHPYQLDLCDEIGLMVYEENLAAWLLKDSPKMAERFDRSLREMILRDRNHPSLTVWGLLNETEDGPVFQRAVDSLKLLRELDDTRLALLGSGRWDGRLDIGSLSNPGSGQWECQWGIESPDNEVKATWGAYGGYFTGAGDAHVYPGTPHTPEIENGIRTLGANSKPVFLSEYGIGSLMNPVRELRTYEQHQINPALDDVQYFQATVDKFYADWQRYGLDGVYPFAEDMLRDSQRMHCQQRILGFNLIRSNPKICGYNLTGLLDHGFTGEGLWTFWRQWKPGIMDALRDGWAPLRWCLFAAPMHAYAGQPAKLEAILANEDVLAPGEYPVTLRIVGSGGIAREITTQVVVPAPAPGEDGPLAIPVFAGDVEMPAEPGKYTFAAQLDHGGYPEGGRLDFYVSAAPPKAEVEVVAVGLNDATRAVLENGGVKLLPFDTVVERPAVVLVADIAQDDRETRVELLRRAARGSAVMFLAPAVFKRGDDPVGWLPLKEKGGINNFSDWLYHKECIAKRHPLFDGLQSRGIMDWDYYGPVISRLFFEGQATPDDTVAVALALCHSGPPGGYASGVMMGGYKFGAGWIYLNTFNVVDNAGKHPAADRILMNMVSSSSKQLGAEQAPEPDDFDAKLAEIGY